jgi:hypothetical protein
MCWIPPRHKRNLSSFLTPSDLIDDGLAPVTFAWLQGDVGLQVTTTATDDKTETNLSGQPAIPP